MASPVWMPITILVPASATAVATVISTDIWSLAPHVMMATSVPRMIYATAMAIAYRARPLLTARLVAPTVKVFAAAVRALSWAQIQIAVIAGIPAQTENNAVRRIYVAA